MQKPSLTIGTVLILALGVAGCTQTVRDSRVPDNLRSNPAFKTHAHTAYKTRLFQTMDGRVNTRQVDPVDFSTHPNLDLSRMDIRSLSNTVVTTSHQDGAIRYSDVLTMESRMNAEKVPISKQQYKGTLIDTLAGLQQIYLEWQLPEGINRQIWSDFTQIEGKLFPPKVGNKLSYHVHKSAELIPDSEPPRCKPEYDIRMTFEIKARVPGRRINTSLTGDTYLILGTENWDYQSFSEDFGECRPAKATRYAYYYYIPSLDLAFKERMLEDWKKDNHYFIDLNILDAFE